MAALGLDRWGLRIGLVFKPDHVKPMHNTRMHGTKTKYAADQAREAGEVISNGLQGADGGAVAAHHAHAR